MDGMKVRKVLFTACVALCLLPQIGTSTALVAGILFSILAGNPWPKKTAKLSHVILQISVVGLGFGLSLAEVLKTGKDSVVFTVAGISGTLLLGHFLGRLLKTGRNTSALISFGTAICGGSAIAALAPVLKAEDDETAVSLATVFTLNAVALLLFPLVGHALHLDQAVFGTWAGLAIHDTSSVVGAAASYGPQALAIATTVKLTRAIWITPIVLVAAWLNKSERKAQVPLFIVGFILAATCRTLFPQYGPYWAGLASVAKQSLVLTLFLIGAGLSKEVLKTVGARPLLQGVILWLAVSCATLTAILLLGIS
jgi:uncharacterized integral membrane protein (TIGR00698 family)